MGNIAPAHTNAFQKERLGWLNYGSSPPIQTVTSSGTYRIDPMATSGVYPKALKILKSGTTAGSRTAIYVEVRTTSGFDANAAPGVLVHTGSESSGSTSNQIDLARHRAALIPFSTPDRPSPTARLDSAFAPSPRTARAHRSRSASMAAARPPARRAHRRCRCRRRRRRRRTLGQPVSYTVTVANTDNTSCSASTFTFGASVPSGWSAGYDWSSVTLTPGTSGYAVLTITPSATALGTASFTATATRSGSTGPSGSVNGSVTVATLATSLDVGVSASNVRGSIQMTASVGAGGAPALARRYIPVDGSEGKRAHGDRHDQYERRGFGLDQAAAEGSARDLPGAGKRQRKWADGVSDDDGDELGLRLEA